MPTNHSYISSVYNLLFVLSTALFLLSSNYYSLSIAVWAFCKWSGFLLLLLESTLMKHFPLSLDTNVERCAVPRSLMMFVLKWLEPNSSWKWPRGASSAVSWYDTWNFYKRHFPQVSEYILVSVWNKFKADKRNKVILKSIYENVSGDLHFPFLCVPQ